MGVRVIIGDCRDRLRDLDAGSVNTCVTSPLGGAAAHLVERLRRCEAGLHGVGQRLGACRASSVTATTRYPRDLALLLQRAKSKTVQRLLSLDAEVRKDGLEAGVRAKVCRLPRVERAPSLRRCVVDPQATAERVPQERRNLRRDVLQHDALAEHRSARIAAHPHRIGGSLHADAPVAVDGASQIGIEEVVAHDR